MRRTQGEVVVSMLSDPLAPGTLVVILLDRNGNCKLGELAITTGRPGTAKRTVKKNIFGGKSNKSWVEVIIPNKGLHCLMRRWIVSADDYVNMQEKPTVSEVW